MTDVIAREMLEANPNVVNAAIAKATGQDKYTDADDVADWLKPLRAEARRSRALAHEPP